MQKLTKRRLDEFVLKGETVGGFVMNSFSPDQPYDTQLFDSAFLAKLEQIQWRVRRLFQGQQRAEHRSHKTGSSLEFADYRNYSHGDDLRAVDWNIYGRLNRLFVKVFEREENVPISILVDASTSMRWQPEGTLVASKWILAGRIAASLAYIGLIQQEQVGLYLFQNDLCGSLESMQGRSHFHKILNFLSKSPRDDIANSSLEQSVKTLIRRLKQRGILVVISDFLYHDGYENGLQMARRLGFDVRVMQIMHPQELEPEILGDWQLEDCESKATLDVTTDPVFLQRYRENVMGFLKALEQFCVRREIAYLHAISTANFEDLILDHLRQKGVLR